LWHERLRHRQPYARHRDLPIRRGKHGKGSGGGGPVAEGGGGEATGVGQEIGRDGGEGDAQ